MYDDRGRFLIRGIFAEMSVTPQYDPVYTLKVEDTDLPSAYKIYMSCVDEYEAAIKLVGNMKNWRMLEKAKWFKEGVVEIGFEGLDRWREDMAARDRSIAKLQLLEAAENGSVQAMNKMYNIGEGKKASPRKKAEKPKVKEVPNKVVEIARNING